MANGSVSFWAWVDNVAERAGEHLPPDLATAAARYLSRGASALARLEGLISGRAPAQQVISAVEECAEAGEELAAHLKSSISGNLPAARPPSTPKPESQGQTERGRPAPVAPATRARGAPAAPPARASSADPHPPKNSGAQAALDRQIKSAYLRVTRGEVNEYIRLADLRVALGGVSDSAWRGEVRDALIRFRRAGVGLLNPMVNPQAIRPEDDAAALNDGGERRDTFLLRWV